ncbi:MAG: hypothetical protein NT162_03130 [Candidatus Woesebacteria bacterium]|nr:hypothetical protein [Candidatus Woesebacteria bacterium]
MSKNKFYWIVGVLVLVAVAWWGWGKWQNERLLTRYELGGEKAVTPAEFLRVAKLLEEKYKQDTYGGATPEATLALFVAALKKGDDNLAVKYFLPENQTKALNDIKVIRGKNTMDKDIQDITTYPTKWCNDKNTECAFSRQYEDKSVSMIEFRLNITNKIWKIVSW